MSDRCCDFTGAGYISDFLLFTEDDFRYCASVWAVCRLISVIIAVWSVCIAPNLGARVVLTTVLAGLIAVLVIAPKIQRSCPGLALVNVRFTFLAV